MAGVRNSDPRTVEAIIGDRYWLTPAGCAATGGHSWSDSAICKACGTGRPEGSS